MTTYNTYQEAKIANPEREIYTGGNGFASGDGFALNAIRTVQLSVLDSYKCNPADYCMTVERFLADGYEFVEGDVFINSLGKVKTVTNNEKWISTLNLRGFGDDERYILRAAALEEKKPRTKVEYVPCEYIDAWEPVKAYCDGDELFNEHNNKVSCPEVALKLWIHGKLYRRIETPMTERDELLEALQSVWIIDGVDGQEQLEKIVDSGLFKLVN